MALTFPRAMPTEGAAEQNLEIGRVDYQSPELGGRVGSVTAGFPRWKFTVNLGAMSREDGDAWRAFKDSLRGSARTFYARDLLRDYPAAYPAGFAGMNRAGGGAFPADGAASSWSVNVARDVLTLNGLPAGFQFRLGDLVGFVWSGNRRTLARVVEAANASGGGSVSMSVEPPIPSLVPVDAATKLYRPEVVMRLLPDTAIGLEDTINTNGGQIVAIEDLRA